MKRRGFLAGILAAGFAPATIGSGVLMPVRRILAPVRRTSGIFTFTDHEGDSRAAESLVREWVAAHGATLTALTCHPPQASVSDPLAQMASVQWEGVVYS